MTRDAYVVQLLQERERRDRALSRATSRGEAMRHGRCLVQIAEELERNETLERPHWRSGFAQDPGWDRTAGSGVVCPPDFSLVRQSRFSTPTRR